MISEEEGRHLLELFRALLENPNSEIKSDYPKPRKTKFSGVSESSAFTRYLNKKTGVFFSVLSEGGRKQFGNYLAFSTILESLLEHTKQMRKTIKKEDLEKIKLEVSLVTDPAPIQIKLPSDYFNIICIGEDGLMLQYGPYSSVILPHVAAENNWSIEEYLNNLCAEAQLANNMWRNPDVIIYKFTAQTFRE